MAEERFLTRSNLEVAAVTADEMRSIDRLAVEEFGLGLLQMMENAGRTLAWHVRDVSDGPVLVVAGSGGNGGGGLASARHLANRDVAVEVVLDRRPEKLTGAAAQQCGILDEMGVSISVGTDVADRDGEFAAVVDALIGYGLSGEVRGSARGLIEWMNRYQAPIVSLDVPSGVDATNGEMQGAAVTPDRTVTLALPKTGLANSGETLFLADIGIPRAVYERLGVEYEDPFRECPWVELVR